MKKISSITLTKQTRIEYQQIMSEGNTRLKEIMEMVGYSNIDVIKSKLFKKNPCCFSVFEQDALPLSTIIYIKQSLPYIQKVRNIEWEMIRGYTNLACKIFLSMWKRYGTQIGCPSEDAYQEAHLGLLKAIYSYTDTKVNFSTFAYVAIRNSLFQSFIQSSFFGSLSQEVVKLIKDFEQKKLELNRPCNDEEVMTLMGLSAKDRRRITLGTAKVYDSTIYRNMATAYDGEYCNDYTALRVGIDKEEGDKIEATFVRLALQSVELSDMEKHILKCFLYEDVNGWRTYLGKVYGITSQAIANCLERSLAKIRKAYMQLTNQELETI